MILSKAVRRAAGRLERMPPEAPKNTLDIVIVLAEAMRFGYSETLGTWHLFDLTRAIVQAVKDKDKKTVAIECGERSDCVQLKAPEIIKELYELKKLLTRAMLFSSRKRFLALCATGFDNEDVLLRMRTARILKPAFTVIRDKESKCLFVFVRGTRSLKDMLTDAIGDPIPFDHQFICGDGELRRNNTVSGHAHRGMVSAAFWIYKRCTTVLIDAVLENPDFKIKIVGHSLGGGTAALLTYKLRQIKELSSCTCVTFGPAACVTLELAEFGKPFITSIINGSDMVPTLSAFAVHDFISKGRIKDKNIVTAVGSRLPFAKTIAQHAVTHCTQIVKKHKQGTFPLLSRSRRENIGAMSSSKSKNLVEASQSSETSCESLLTEQDLIIESISDDEEYNSSSEESEDDDSDDDEDELLNQVGKLKLEKQDNNPNIHAWGKEAATTKNITQEESGCPVPTSVNLDRHPLYPPGRIMHIVPAPSFENYNSKLKHLDEKRVHLYETPAQLYGKLRLSRGMILDHPTKKYLKKLIQLIDHLEKESFKYGGR